MIIAHGNLPRIKIPPVVRRLSRQPCIDTSTDAVPMGADIWIACTKAWPHIDESYDVDMVFLTMSIVSDHIAGDAEFSEVNAPVPAGTLFVIDPHVPHWLGAQDAWMTHKNYPWIGLQWELARDRAPAKAREIVEAISGVWDIRDDRYRGWNIDGAP